MNYQESRLYIKEAEKYQSILGLQNIRELMKRLGNPQDDLKYVHVAGTNGKGSVIACLYSVLTEAGYRVGRYVSPTLFSYRERMEVSGKRVSREQFAGYMTRIAEAACKMTEEGLAHPTVFELETAAAFLYFKEENCDLVLLEVGLGGDLDATNIIGCPLVSVLTSISMDHMGYLGNTLKEIAEKKAGIIKPGGIAVTVKQPAAAEQAFREMCDRQGAALVVADPEEAEVAESDVERQVLRYRGEEYIIALSGKYQVENAVLALTVLEVLGKQGYPVSSEQKKAGLLKARWKGRFTVIHKNPLFLVDGAHNPAAALRLAQSIEQYFPGKELIYIMGVFRDKDYESVIAHTYGYAKKILTIETPDNDRALPAKELARAVSKFHPDVEAADSIEAAVEKAFALAGRDRVILAFGSLSFLGRITEAVEKREE